MLDTHALIWWVNGDGLLSAKGRKAIERELGGDGRIMISTISAWEMAMLIEKGRLALTMDLDEWLNTVAAIEAVAFMPIDPDIAAASARLPGEFPADPADPLIVALARHYSVPLVTADARIKNYHHIKTLWQVGYPIISAASMRCSANRSMKRVSINAGLAQRRGSTDVGFVEQFNKNRCACW